ncbi:MAG TPA: hypothetical protein VNB06_05275, partial [Thermoanaerobaculia bacterium]|nr:hypothetical protein [Thermoanaerobaculia bacterium]
MHLRPIDPRPTGRRVERGVAAALAVAMLWLTAASPAAAESVRLSGRLATWDDRPLAGVEVSLRADAPAWERTLAAWEGRAPAATLATARTDPDGFFLLEAPAPGFWELVARGEGVAASRRVIAESSVELGTWMPPRTRTIEVDVIGAGDRPVPGARAATAQSQWNDAIPDEDRRAVTDARGRARLLGPSQDVWLVAQAPETTVAVERLRAVTTTEPGEAPPAARV